MSLHITKHTTGKMAGFVSINTSVVNNKFCEKMRSSCNNVCSSCYAVRLEKFRTSLGENIKLNSIILSDSLLDDSSIPKFKPKTLVRWHSFGEIINRIHVNNIIKIANSNPESQFTLFTKRVNMIDRDDIPNNVIVIVSSPEVDKPLEKEKLPDRVNKIFTVYKKDKNNEYPVTINCMQSCAECMKCYNKEDKTIYINEALR